ncbi:unnamed protein product [marine sediment metagenome]|uniref:Uncharacterized protein n=1 Tax=marine sediment metagenome TaxID=412755 RepID=X1L5A6_9ZZZZ
MTRGKGDLERVMPIDKKTGLMAPPIYPCYKGEGLCDIRFVDTTNFQCLGNPATCRNRHAIKVEPEAKESAVGQDDTAKMWANMGRKPGV